MKGFTKYNDLRAEWFKDPKFRKAYRDLEPEFKAMDFLIRKRIKQNLSQKQLAQKLGTGQSVISRFENGNFNPTINFLKRLANALDTELEIKFTAKR